MPRTATAITVPRRASGTTSTTAAGFDQLSYCAASTRYTSSTESAKISVASPPTFFSWYAMPVQS